MLHLPFPAYLRGNRGKEIVWLKVGRKQSRTRFSPDSNHVLLFPCCRDRVACDSNSRTRHGLYRYVQFLCQIIKLSLFGENYSKSSRNAFGFAFAGADSEFRRRDPGLPITSFKQPITFQSGCSRLVSKSVALSFCHTAIAHPAASDRGPAASSCVRWQESGHSC